jgi:hypothetical protein
MYYVIRRNRYFVREFDNLHDADWFVETMLEKGIDDCKVIRSQQGLNDYKKRMQDDCDNMQASEE